MYCRFLRITDSFPVLRFLVDSAEIVGIGGQSDPLCCWFLTRVPKLSRPQLSLHSAALLPTNLVEGVEVLFVGQLTDHGLYLDQLAGLTRFVSHQVAERLGGAVGRGG